MVVYTKARCSMHDGAHPQLGASLTFQPPSDSWIRWWGGLDPVPRGSGSSEKFSMDCLNCSSGAFCRGRRISKPLCHLKKRAEEEGQREEHHDNDDDDDNDDNDDDDDDDDDDEEKTLEEEEEDEEEEEKKAEEEEDDGGGGGKRG
ncbi:hypothetical protein PoB_005334700 [Plakobranchus ocellatus]|uniref:Uncharacterized protein n=1 Tax=Plakobranchus ocellatus TaxID=259542 RepID=A0AAV4C630_9GAST|nr:hypothetical protein PoB_005334700 [Plakobranchus ocellatus]